MSVHAAAKRTQPLFGIGVPSHVKVGDNLALTIFYILILTIRHYNGHTLVMGLFQMSFVATLAQVNIKVLDQFSFSHINHVLILQNMAQHSLQG